MYSAIIFERSFAQNGQTITAHSVLCSQDGHEIILFWLRSSSLPILILLLMMPSISTLFLCFSVMTMCHGTWVISKIKPFLGLKVVDNDIVLPSKLEQEPYNVYIHNHVSQLSTLLPL